MGTSKEPQKQGDYSAGISVYRETRVKRPHSYTTLLEWLTNYLLIFLTKN